MNKKQTRPNSHKALETLKEFQLKTVDYIFQRLYTDQPHTRRFLLADEVGLGKTLVARGVIFRAIEWLRQQGVPRIDIVYICSNSDIARQNINRLNISKEENFALASRITLLPTQISNLVKRDLNFISFTPGTSFNLQSTMGTGDERVLLHSLLTGAWNLQGKAPQNVLQGNMYAGNFRWKVRQFDRGRIDQGIEQAFYKELDGSIKLDKSSGTRDLHSRFLELCKHFNRYDSIVSHDIWRERSSLIGDLRSLLARTCLDALEPDLIILDEFQRFRKLLHGNNEAALLAKDLFNYSDEKTSTRVLLMSATPYKMYTRNCDPEENHYQDFLETLDFLIEDKEEFTRLKEQVGRFKESLFKIGESDTSHVIAEKQQLERTLLKYMVRNERLAVSTVRDGMLIEVPDLSIKLQKGDLRSYITLDKVTNHLSLSNHLEYWKSSPYLLNFMESYVFKKAFKEAIQIQEDGKDLIRLINGSEDLLLDVRGNILRFNSVDPMNPRMRSLQADTLDKETWKLLWAPPSLPYYKLGGPFSSAGINRFTKRLVFSSWKVVPRALAILMSYEAEKRMIVSYQKEARNTSKARSRRGGRLRFAAGKDKRLVGLPVLTMLYPSVTLACEADPLVYGGKLVSDTFPPSVGALQEMIEKRITELLADLGTRHHSKGPIDIKWYWFAPILLDLVNYQKKTKLWWEQENLPQIWSDREDGSTGREVSALWVEHVLRVQEMISDWKLGKVFLGPPPPDLVPFLAQLSLGSPAIALLRAFTRISKGNSNLSEIEYRNSAAKVAWSFMSLFNLPEVTNMIRGLNSEEPYWRRVIEYCMNGGIQSVLDEYVHCLRDSLGLIDESQEAILDEISAALQYALRIRTGSPELDHIWIDREENAIYMDKHGMRSRFCMQFGDQRAEDSNVPTRSDQVRAAFNSPFWPFILATTSVGQEGLDFHTYCHAVMHWNLPSNPVDLEQREGRVHRYKGHAVRKNLAAQYGKLAINKADSSNFDPWECMFEMGREEYAKDHDEMVPYWVFPLENGAKIERHLPILPLSRESKRIKSLKRSLAVYRMVFGQNRQEDMVDFLANRIPEDKIEEVSKCIRIDLTPPNS